MQAKRIWMSGLFFVLAAHGTSVVAQAPLSGFYVGASGGTTDARTACHTSGLPAGATVTSCDKKDAGWKLYGGYQFTPHWGVETGYHDFGKFNASISALGVPVTGEAEATGWHLFGTGTLPLSPQFDVFGKIGVHWSEVDSRASGAGIAVSASGDSTQFAWGLGAKWNFTRNAALRLEWERFHDVGNSNTGSSDVEMLSIGVMFRF